MQDTKHERWRSIRLGLLCLFIAIIMSMLIYWPVYWYNSAWSVLFVIPILFLVFIGRRQSKKSDQHFKWYGLSITTPILGFATVGSAFEVLEYPEAMLINTGVFVLNLWLAMKSVKWFKRFCIVLVIIYLMLSLGIYSV